MAAEPSRELAKHSAESAELSQLGYTMSLLYGGAGAHELRERNEVESSALRPIAGHALGGCLEVVCLSRARGDTQGAALRWQCRTRRRLEGGESNMCMCSW